MQYKDINTHFIVEKFLGDDNDNLPEDYKFYCMNGRCEFIMVCIGRDEHGHGACYEFFDRDWNQITETTEMEKSGFEKPKLLDKAIWYAETISRDFPFVRVDLYIFKEEIIFGEMTFTPAAGMDIDFLKTVIGANEDIDHVYGRKLSINK